MEDDLFERLMAHTKGQVHVQHPAFVLQDQYVLTPERLSPREKMHVFRHLRKCAFCKRMQAHLRSKPDDALAVWGAPDPRHT